MKTYLAMILSCLILFGTSAQADLSDGLILHYAFDTDEGAIVTDQSGWGNDGTVHGASWVPDSPCGGAMNFDGDDYIRVARDPSLEPTALTMAAWVRFHEMDGLSQTVFFKKNPNIHYHEDYTLLYMADYGDDFRYVVANAAHQQGTLDSVTHPSSGTWYHVVATFEQPTMKLYVNGKLEGQQTHDSPLHHDATRDLLIGTTDEVGGPLHWFLKGDLDEVRIYDRALSAAEVGELFLKDSLVLYFPFDTDDGATATDQSGWGNDGGVFGATYDTDPVRGGVYSFDGSNDYIQVPNNASLNPVIFTASAWVYSRDPAVVLDRGIIGKHKQYDDRTFYWLMQDPTAIGATMGGGSWSQIHIRTSPTDVINQWGMVTLTYDGTTMRYYVNGLLRGSRSVSGYAGNAYDVLVGAGEWENSGAVPQRWWDGFIDDVRIYNCALSDGQVYALYTSTMTGNQPPAGAALISLIGFSDAPDGDQDVTEFLNDETLHICVKDVDLDAADPACSVLVIVFQKKKWSDAKRSRRIRLLLDPQEDGSFTGAIPLDQLGAGMAEVQILGNKKKGKEKLHRTGYIFINPAP